MQKSMYSIYRIYALKLKFIFTSQLFFLFVSSNKNSEVNIYFYYCLNNEKL